MVPDPLSMTAQVPSEMVLRGALELACDRLSELSDTYPPRTRRDLMREYLDLAIAYLRHHPAKEGHPADKATVSLPFTIRLNQGRSIATTVELSSEQFELLGQEMQCRIPFELKVSYAPSGFQLMACDDAWTR
jgi:hypothetical protein